MFEMIDLFSFCFFCFQPVRIMVLLFNLITGHGVQTIVVPANAWEEPCSVQLTLAVRVGINRLLSTNCYYTSILTWIT